MNVEALLSIALGFIITIGGYGMIYDATNQSPSWKQIAIAAITWTITSYFFIAIFPATLGK